MRSKHGNCIFCGGLMPEKTFAVYANDHGGGVRVCEPCLSKGGNDDCSGRYSGESIRRFIYLDDVVAVQRFLLDHRELRSWVMHEAASAGRPCIAAYLLESGNGIDLDNALSDAVLPRESVEQHLGHVRVADLLLKRGASLEVRGGWRYETPLMAAAGSGNGEMVELLMSYVKDLDIFSAAVVGDVEVVSRWLNGQPDLVNAIDESGAMAMHYCASSCLGIEDDLVAAGLLEIAELLFGAGGEIDAAEEPVSVSRYPVGMRPLHFASNGNMDVAKWLIDKGVSVDSFDRWRRTPLQIALEHSFEIAELLFESGADVNIINGDDGTSALHALVDGGNLRGVEWLVAHGANVNLAGVDGRTGLHHASRRDSSGEMVRVLVESGAELNVIDCRGKTAMDYASVSGRAGIADMLRSYGGVAS